MYYKYFEHWSFGKGLELLHIINSGRSLGDARYVVTHSLPALDHHFPRAAHVSKTPTRLFGPYVFAELIGARCRSFCDQLQKLSLARTWLSLLLILRLHRMVLRSRLCFSSLRPQIQPALRSGLARHLAAAQASPQR